MLRYTLIRIIQAVITVWCVSVIVFGLARLTGNPLDIIMPPEATEEDYARVSVELGLDRPLPVQYGVFIKSALQGKFGESLRFRKPAMEVVLERLPNTIQLGALAFVFAVLIALPIGVYSAKHRGSPLDNFGRGFAILGQSVPHFWTGIMLILVFAVWLHLLPASGKGGIEYFILPAITQAYVITAGIMRITRSAMLDVLDTEYIKLARGKGLRESIVTWKHAARNAMIPVLTFSAMTFIRVLVGSLVVETVFAWPGVGRLVVESVMYRDYTVIQTVVLLFSIMFIIGNLITDILYVYADPKIKYSGK